MNEELSCPACRKPNPVASEDPCPRCEADLNSLRRIRRHADREQSLARDALRSGRWPVAHQHALRSWNLWHSPASARLAFLASVADPVLGNPAVWLERAQT